MHDLEQNVETNCKIPELDLNQINVIFLRRDRQVNFDEGLGGTTEEITSSKKSKSTFSRIRALCFVIHVDFQFRGLNFLIFYLENTY